jgi:hypothetical protein
MEAYQYLASLRDMVKARREETKERLARPIEDPMKRERMVGECIALEWLVDKVNAQIKSINSGDDDADDTPKRPRPDFQ